MPFIQDLQKNRIKEGIPYAMGIHVDWGNIGTGNRKDCCGQILEIEGLE